MHVEVTGRGRVTQQERRRAHERIEALDRYLPGRVLRARVVLRHEANPRIERSARAECDLHLNGPIVRGQVAEVDMPRAIDALARHLEHQLRRFAERRASAGRRGPGPPPGEWRHGDWSPPRPDYARRPAAERSVMRRKTFALEPMTPQEAAWDLEALDHAFYLFQDLDTGADAVVYRRDDGRLGVIGPAGRGWAEDPAAGEPVREESRVNGATSLDDAIAEMDELDHRFLYFVDAETGRGNVIYLRIDGHYGLIGPR